MVLLASLDSAPLTHRPKSVASASASATGFPAHLFTRKFTNADELAAISASDAGSIASRNCIGADPSARDQLGQGPLHAAAKKGQLEALRVLKELGCDVHQVRSLA